MSGDRRCTGLALLTLWRRFGHLFGHDLRWVRSVGQLPGLRFYNRWLSRSGRGRRGDGCRLARRSCSCRRQRFLRWRRRVGGHRLRNRWSMNRLLVIGRSLSRWVCRSLNCLRRNLLRIDGCLGGWGLDLRCLCLRIWHGRWNRCRLNRRRIGRTCRNRRLNLIPAGWARTNDAGQAGWNGQFDSASRAKE